MVFDEVHYMQDRERGVVWEETIIFLPPETKMVGACPLIVAPLMYSAWLPFGPQATVHKSSTCLNMYVGMLQALSDDDWHGRPSKCMPHQDTFGPGISIAVHIRFRACHTLTVHADSLKYY